MIEYTFNSSYNKIDLVDYNIIKITPITNSSDKKNEYSIKTEEAMILEVKKQECSWKEVVRLRFDLKRDFKPGDAIGIVAPNSGDLVDNLMVLCGFRDMLCRIERTGTHPFVFEGALHTFFREQMDLTNLPRKALLMSLAKEAMKRKELEYLCSKEGTADYFKLGRNMNTIPEIIREFGCKPSLESLLKYCELIRPRYYTLINKKDDDCEIILGVIARKASEGMRYGHVSGLVKRASEGGITLGPLNICFRGNVLMRGLKYDNLFCFCSGTGIAPFIAIYNNSSNPSNLCLIYGFRNEEDDLSEIYSLRCKIHKAKSSDGVYVQNYVHLLEGAADRCHVFICGNPRMQKGVFNEIRTKYPVIVEERRIFFDSWQ